MDSRQLLEDALAMASPKLRRTTAERVVLADSLLRKVVVHIPNCLWGDEMAREQGRTKETNWWYFASPIKAGPELMTDLKALR